MGLGKLKRGSLSAVAALLMSTAAFAQDAGSTDPTTDHVVVQNWHDLNPAAGEGIAVGGPDPSGNGTVTDQPTDQGATDDVPVQNWHDINPAGGGDGTVVGEPDPTGDGTGNDASGDNPAADPGSDGTGDQATGDNGEVTAYSMNGGAVIAGAHSSKPVVMERNQTTKHHSAATAMATTAMAQCLSVHPRATWICEWQNGAGN